MIERIDVTNLFLKIPVGMRIYDELKEPPPTNISI